MRNDEWYAGGVEEAIVLDGIPSDPLKQRPIKRHGKVISERAKCGTMCRRKESRIHFLEECASRGSAYSESLSKDARQATSKLIESYHGYTVLECYANGDFVGVALCHKRGKFVLWRSFNPIARTFGDESIVQGRSSGLTHDDVIRLSGYETGDIVRIVRC